MSFIPDTTPTPNWLYNGEMKKMSDTELRVVLVVTRQTLGWIENEETGMRKTEDWISQKQLVEKTGRSNRAISTAINNCIKNKWIEARDKTGNLLKTPEERSGNKVFYRLGNIFTDKLKKTSEDSSQVKKPVNLTTQTSEPNDTPSITKETIHKDVQNAHTSFFSLFWEEYPKKINKQRARVIFKKLKITNTLLKVILDSIKKSKQTTGWKKNNGQYIPHPSTWLNDKRWEDEAQKKEGGWR